MNLSPRRTSELALTALLWSILVVLVELGLARSFGAGDSVNRIGLLPLGQWAAAVPSLTVFAWIVCLPALVALSVVALPLHLVILLLPEQLAPFGQQFVTLVTGAGLWAYLWFVVVRALEAARVTVPRH
jgi:hypothetical protein